MMKKTNIRIDLRIMGDEYDIDELSKELNITPTDFWKNHDSIRNTGKQRTYTAWIYSTGEKETLNINTQVEEIENLFLSKTDILYTWKIKYNLEFSIDIVIVIENNEPPAIYLEGPILQFASKLDIKFDFDTYVN